MNPNFREYGARLLCLLPQHPHRQGIQQMPNKTSVNDDQKAVGADSASPIFSHLGLMNLKREPGWAWDKSRG